MEKEAAYQLIASSIDTIINYQSINELIDNLHFYLKQ